MDEPRCGDGCSYSGDGERFDELFGALADERRRHVLYCLREEERTELEALCVRITSRLLDRSADELPEDVVEDLRTELHHVHLPLLDDCGVIEYDSRSNAVVYREPPEAIETLLEFCAEREFED